MNEISNAPCGFFRKGVHRIGTELFNGDWFLIFLPPSHHRQHMIFIQKINTGESRLPEPGKLNGKFLHPVKGITADHGTFLYNLRERSRA